MSVVAVAGGGARLPLSLSLWLGLLALILVSLSAHSIQPGPVLAGAISLALLMAANQAALQTCPSWPMAARRFAVPAIIFCAAGIQALLDHRFGLLLGALPGGHAPGSPSWIFLTYLLFFALNAALPALSAGGARIREAQADAASAEAAMLRLQLNPHVMVNSLNAVTSLILSGQQGKAAAMTDKLAQFLRISLQMSKPFISLGDELMMIEAYLAAESIRFGDRLDIRIDCPDELEDQEVPSFLLQPLVENAVKHGLAGSVGTVILSVRIARERNSLRLTIETDAGGGGHTVPSTLGLANTQSRLAALYGPSASFQAETDKSGYRGEVSLPLTSRKK